MHMRGGAGRSVEGGVWGGLGGLGIEFWKVGGMDDGRGEKE